MSDIQIPLYAKAEFKRDTALLDLITKLHDQFKKEINVDKYNESGGILEFKVNITDETRPLLEELIDIDQYNEAFKEYSHEPEVGKVDLSMLANDQESVHGASKEIVWYENQYDDNADDEEWTFAYLKRQWDEMDEQIGDDEDWGSSDFLDEDFDDDDEFDDDDFSDFVDDDDDFCVTVDDED